jgi:hypothetical protein
MFEINDLVTMDKRIPGRIVEINEERTAFLVEYRRATPHHLSPTKDEGVYREWRTPDKLERRDPVAEDSFYYG